jgi:hypothetical protein
MASNGQVLVLALLATPEAMATDWMNLVTLHFSSLALIRLGLS